MDKEDVVHIHNGILFSHIKEQDNSICSNGDATRDYHTKQSKSWRERQIPHGITYIWKLKYGTNEFLYKSETDTDTENRLVVAKVGGMKAWQCEVSKASYSI